MDSTPYIIAGICTLITGICFLMVWRHDRPKRVTIDIPFTVSTVVKDYYDLYKRINGAVTKSELAALEMMVEEFEFTYRSRTDVREFYVDLMVELQSRHNVIEAKGIKNLT
jgi:hypothetical protein